MDLHYDPFGNRDFTEERINAVTLTLCRWLQGDAELRGMCLLLVARARHEASGEHPVSTSHETLRHGERYLLAEMLEERLREMAPVSNSDNLWDDLLLSALDDIDWERLALRLLSENTNGS